MKIRTIVAALGLVGSLVAGGAPAKAHGTGTVTMNSVFAVCKPPVGLAAASPYPCSPGKSITVSLSTFPANTPVYVYFLNGEVDDPNATTCAQALAMPKYSGLTALSGSPVTTNGSGTANLPAQHFAPGLHTVKWSYGQNWVCATTNPTGAGGIIGDRLFTVYPA